MRLLWLLAAGLLILAGLMEAPAQDRSQGRSIVMTRYGIVAAESPLAAQAGAIVLAEGGTAVDAAVAANAVMGVVAPMMNGLGGDLFALVYDVHQKKYYGLNASGWAPRGLTAEFLRRQGFQSMPRRGIYAVTVPGVVDGWTKLLQRFGKKTLAEVLAPAIRYAEEGFPVPEMTAAAWAEAVPFLQSQPSAARLYLPEGKAPQPGELFHNPELARSLRLLARQGRDAFYRGEIAARILELSRRLGGRDGDGRPGRVFQPVGGAPCRGLSRLACLRAAAQRPGNCRTGDVESNGAVSSGALRRRLGGRAACDDRSQETGLCRSGEVCG